MDPLPSAAEIDALVEAAEAWAIGHGIIMRDASQTIHHAPFSLLPVRVPRASFEQVCGMCALFNSLVDRYARDLPFIERSLRHTVEADEFTRRLLELYRRVHAEGIAQPLYLGVHRADYLLHQPAGTAASDAVFLQVEVNTISSAFAGLSTQVTKLHRFMLERHINSPAYPPSALPLNEPVDRVADALAHAVRLFSASSASAPASTSTSSASAASPVVLMIVQPGERNTADQRAIEYALWERHSVRVVRRSLAEIEQRGTLDGEDTASSSSQSPSSSSSASAMQASSHATPRVLRIDGHTVGVAYFRAGYTPNDYPSAAEWRARERVERSTAIKCPPVAYQLAGTKKLQQSLAAPGVVERYLGAADGARLRACFAGLWALDATAQDEVAGADADAGGGSDGSGESRGGNNEAVVQRAIQHPDKFVLKPQREGGGNNFYNGALAAKLSALPVAERAEFILMARIEPPLQPALLVRQGAVTRAAAASELGIYGVFIGNGSTEHLNQIAGHLVRTKPGGVDEGGVAAGYAYLDSPILVDQ